MRDLSVLQDGCSSAISSALLDRVRKQEQAAWERLVSLCTPLLFHWSMKAGLQLPDVEDVCQEVFVAVARNLATFRHDHPCVTFRGWLRTIAMNKIRDRIIPPGARGRGGSDAQPRSQQLPGVDGGESGSDSDREDVGILYRRAVELIEGEFEPKIRRAFWLVVMGRRPADVAAELQMSVGAVYTAKSRFSKRFRDEFSGLLDQPAAAQPTESR